MKGKHLKTLQSVFAKPTRTSVVFADLEALVLSLGGEIIQRGGSRMAFMLNQARLDMHRPHPGKEARRYQVEELRAWLTHLEITP